MIRNRLKGWAAAAGLLCAGATQASAAMLPVLAQMKVTEANAKNYVLESLITVVLIAGALFIVCKTSRRS